MLPAITCALLSALPPERQLPNIILIMTDQQTAGAMSCSGNPYLHTPNMDRLADAGVSMTSAYCTAPVSGPSRAALFTGFYPDGIGLIRNGAPFPEALQEATLGRKLSDTGYDCAYGGKWHVGPELSVPQWAGFERIHPNGDPGLAQAASAWLKRPHEKPFFLVASFVNPHNICEWARFQNLPYGNLPDTPLAGCPPLPPNFERNPDDADVLLAEQGANYSAYPTVRFTEDDWRQYRNAYFRLVEKVDAQIGLILDTIEELGLWENTLVIFTSDHGDGNGAHHWNQKSALYEEVVHVPLIVSLPGKQCAGQTRTQLVSSGIDLYASICDWAGVAVTGDGISLRPMIEADAPGQPLIVTETTFDGGVTRGWMLRTPRYKYVLYDKGKNREQLFEIAADSLECHNLAGSPRHKEQLQHMRKLLAQWFRLHRVHPTRPNISDIPGETLSSQ
ncbi:MAG: sulfatase-like hydrolase/transferase [Bacteroidales bacterium]|nr:sulfatase-like hydrolase/transferase [Bacteroidales bacterium]